MKSVLLIGLGRFGRHVAKKLNELNHEVLAVDFKEDRVEAVMPYVTSAQVVDCTNEEYLRSVGVNNFDMSIVAIGDNFQNSLEITSLLKELGSPLVVSRAASDVQEKFLLRNGADQVVYPEKQLANWTAIRYTSDHILNYIEIEHDYAIFEVPIPKQWIGKTVGNLDIRKKFNINIMAVKENGEMELRVNPDTLLTQDMTMLVLGSNKDIHKCFHI